MAKNASFSGRQSRMIRTMARGMTQSTFGFSPKGGAGGAAKLANQPMIAMATTAIETSNTPPSVSTSLAPNIWPRRMARKVAPWINPLAAGISSRAMYCGRTPYLIGAKKADCAPIRNMSAKRI